MSAKKTSEEIKKLREEIERLRDDVRSIPRYYPPVRMVPVLPPQPLPWYPVWPQPWEPMWGINTVTNATTPLAYTSGGSIDA